MMTEIERLRREKISKALRGRKKPPFSDEHKEKIKKSYKEYLLNNEHWNKGKILSDEVKKKISNYISFLPKNMIINIYFIN